MNWMRLKLVLAGRGQRLDHQRLGQARHALEQQVPLGEVRAEHQLQHFVLADDDLRHFGLDGLGELGRLLRRTNRWRWLI